MTRESIDQLAKDYDSVVKTLLGLKESLNLTKVRLGMALVFMQDLHKIDLIEDNYGTFKQILNELHLNTRRTFNLMENARYLIEIGLLDEEVWKKLDSSVLGFCRKKKINPIDIMEDIEVLLYTDLIKKYEDNN